MSDRPGVAAALKDCDFETLLALEEQMPRERFEQIKQGRPDFARWLAARRQVRGLVTENKTKT